MIDLLKKNIKSAGPEAIASKHQVCVEGKKINNNKRENQAKKDSFNHEGLPTKKIIYNCFLLISNFTCIHF